MDLILKLKHWQVFLILLLGLSIVDVEIEGNQKLSSILGAIGVMIYASWVLLTGHFLYQLIPEKINLNYNLFVINAFVWIASYSSVMIISEGTGMSFSGTQAIPGFYIMFALLHFLIFPVRVLKSIENNRKAGVGECIGDFLLIIFLPIGIWFLQPRINAVAQSISRDA